MRSASRLRYWFQHTLFALRRYLPGPLRQFLKPLYRRWWRRASQKRLEAVLGEARPAAAPDASFAVVCFPTIDWELRVQRPQHLLLRLARTGHPVYYLRTDFGPGARAEPLESLAPGVLGLRLPGPHSLNIYEDQLEATLLESWLGALDRLRLSEGLNEVVALVQLPFWGPLALAARERWGWKVVYDCLDELSGFPFQPSELLSLESTLIQESDLVLAAGRKLYEKCAPLARRCCFLPNAADFEHFHRPGEKVVLAEFNGPVVGYFGALAEWFNSDWVHAAAVRHPEWQFVLIGLNSGADLKALERLPNVRLLGERPYNDLPSYLHRFDAAIIPFREDALTQATNPVKFYEYLCAGKPVVTSDLPELLPFQGLYYPAQTEEEFQQQLEAAVGENDPPRRAARIALASQHTWDARARVLEEQLIQLYPLVSVIIVSFHNLDYLRLCLESIWAKTEYPNYEVIVIDNASPAPVRSYLKESQSTRPRLRVKFNEENAGFAKAVNHGLAMSPGQFLVLLNNDTLVTGGWLNRLVGHLQRDPTLGMIGPVTGWASNEARIPAEYQSLEEIEAFAAQYSREHRGGLQEVKTLDMFCTAVRREVVERVGSLDEGFGVGMFEDDDYALRLRQAGYRLAIAEDVFVHHWGWASFGRLSQAEYDHLFEANRRRFEEKWGIRWERPPQRLRVPP